MMIPPGTDDIDQMNPKTNVTIADIIALEPHVHRFVSPLPLIRSYRLEQELGLPPTRRVWLKDYGWSPTGSFKVLGALGWMLAHHESVGNRPVTASSSGNFASGLAFACQQFGKRAIIVMPDTAPRVKFELTQSFGAEVRTYDISRDHLTRDRQRMTEEIAEHENAVMAHPYDSFDVIAGNAVGGLEIVTELTRLNRAIGEFVCPVSGGGLLAGLALVVKDAFAAATVTAVEPALANDFQQSLAAGKRTSIERPQSICDGLLTYDVGERNWPILQRHVDRCETLTDDEVRMAMRWIYDHHGLRTEPSGAIAVAALLQRRIDPRADGDVVAIISGRNIDETKFRAFFGECH
jgi:threonine dehydratase